MIQKMKGALALITPAFLCSLIVCLTLSCKGTDLTPGAEEVISLNNAEHPFPFFYTAGVPGLYGDSHGGYGYIGLSEAQADSLFRFSCENQPLTYPWKTFSHLDSQLQQTDRRVLQVLRDQVFEFWALHYAGTLRFNSKTKNPEQGFDLKAPHCISSQSSGIQALQELAKLPAPEISGPKTPLSNKQILALSDGTSQRLMMKYRGTYNQLRSQTLAYALAFSDMLDSEIHDVCDDRRKEASCFDVREMQERLHGDFESLFNLPAPQVNYIRHHLITLIGASDNARNRGWKPDMTLAKELTLSESDAFEHGKMIYDSWINEKTTQSIIHLQAGIEQALSDGRTALEKFTAGEKVPVTLKNELSLLRENAKRHWIHYHSEIPKKVLEICDLSYGALIEKYPNAVRQALVDHDSDPGLKSQMRASLCGQGSFRGIQPQQSCSGVHGEQLPSLKPVIISRSVPSFPFNGKNTFSISKKSKADPYHIYLKLEFDFDSDFSEQERAEVLTRWKTNTETWYNCQSGGLTQREQEKLDHGHFTFSKDYFQPFELETKPASTSCATDPELLKEVPEGIRFHFEFTDKNQHNASMSSYHEDNLLFTPTSLSPQKVSIHRCYRAELESNNCLEIRNWLVKRCQKTCATPECIKKCESDTAAVGDARNNRANSSEWISAQRLSTVFHETGHLLGLNDDYTDFALPLNLIAENDNVMCRQNNYPIRLYPRNFFTMLEPLKCSTLTASPSNEPGNTLGAQKKKSRSRSHARTRRE